MIHPENYLAEIAKIDLNTLPLPLQKGHKFLMKATDEGKNWDKYHNSTPIRKTIQLYFERLDDHIQSVVQKSEKRQHKKTIESPKQRSKETKQRTIRPNKTQTGQPEVMLVERIPEELRFIKRFVNLNGKTKTKDELLRFINSLQKAIVEKRIRKTSSYAEQIKSIQHKLIEVYNNMKAKIKIDLKPETLESLKKLTKEEKVRASINFIKNYISLNGKIGIKKKADHLLKRITSMVDKKLIPPDDPYMDELIQITQNLEAFLDDPSMKILAIEKNELNGLEGILGCACEPKRQLAKPTIMNSVDFAKMEFETLGFRGKWLQLIGDPARGFSGMVSGKPKMGKSILCVDFGGYLARNHGKVLYVAKEEGLDYTLQEKLRSKEVAHANLDVASEIPASLGKYDFIFLDSVNKLNLTPEAIEKLKADNYGKSIIGIFQSTKNGQFRGANTFQHDVDVVIEVPEKGKAVQMGRFNQGGEMEIFENEDLKYKQAA